MYLLAYGTLRKGKHNHGLIDHCEYIGKYFTDKSFTLIVSGLPFMVKRDGAGVLGEVYKIDKDTLRAVDKLEGTPDFYKRETITVTNVDTGEPLEVYAYTHPDIFYGKGFPWDYEIKREF